MVSGNGRGKTPKFPCCISVLILLRKMRHESLNSYSGGGKRYNFYNFAHLNLGFKRKVICNFLAFFKITYMTLNVFLGQKGPKVKKYDFFGRI